jgi:hypothetical protein
VASESYCIYDSFTPVIESGQTAEIIVSQTLTQGAAALLHASGSTVKLTVQGPQTSLTEDDISGVYPAPGTTDSPDDYLPHVALKRRTLPWERRGPADGTPWLALLVITQSDLNMRVSPMTVDRNEVIKQSPVASGPKPAAPTVAREVTLAREVTPVTPLSPEALARAAEIAKVSTPAETAKVTVSAGTTKASPPEASQTTTQTTSGEVSLKASGGAVGTTPVGILISTGSITPRSIQVKDLASSDAATRTQLLKNGITDTTSIRAISIPTITLQKILPGPAELKLLCHVKEVIEDGGSTFTSIVISGRLPDAGDMTAAAPQTHAALLVSLENRDDIYTRLDQGGAINLMVLHSWTFVPSKGGDFREVCQMIGYHPNGGVLRFGNTPSSATDPSQALSGGFGNLLDNAGYLAQPLDHSATGNVIWRGPLRPFPPPPRSNGFALRAEPEEFAGAPPLATLDYSHATAFELGKLLALGDDGLREDLRNIHEVFDIPANFVAMSNLPPVLQKPYWGVDQGESLEQSETQIDQALEQPWSFANNQSLLGLQNVVGNGEVGGFSAARAQAWQASISSVMDALQTPAAGGIVSQIDLNSATEAGLSATFPGLVNATIAEGG